MLLKLQKMAKSEAMMLAEMYEKTRLLTRYYLSKLKEVDPFVAQGSGDAQFNSIYWLMAHLAWAENYLVVEMTGGKSVAPHWLNHYSLGADGSVHEGHGSFKELLDDVKAVHEKSMQYLSLLSDEDLAKENAGKFQFGDGDATCRFSVQHAIRHEALHTGHLSLIAKLNKQKTV